MDLLITFFRDVLSGPLYIVVAIISGLLICSCIGYLAERSLKKQEKEKKYAKVAEISVDTNVDNVVVKTEDASGTISNDSEEYNKKDKSSDVKINIEQEALKPTVSVNNENIDK